MPRIYLDTNVLLSAILESDNKWLSDHPQGQEQLRSIRASKEIFDKWEPSHLKTSAFAIGEFISKGQTKKFNKSFTEMLEIATDSILARCQVLYAMIQPEPILGLDERWRNHWILANATWEGSTEDRKGNPLGWLQHELILTINMVVSRYFGGGVPPSLIAGGIPDPNQLMIKEIRSLSYRAPSFEILLFSKASEVANEYKLHLTDAIHLLYAKDEVEYIITNDRDFCNRWKADPSLKKRVSVDVESSDEFLKICKGRQWL